ncbi:MAG: thermonuclease family protein [Pseudomonadota bacterium]
MINWQVLPMLSIPTNWISKNWALSLGIIILLAGLSACKEERLAAPRVIDGDKLELGERRVRLFGVDAPEAKQVCLRQGEHWPCGELAADAVREFIAGRTVRCFEELKKKNGRYVVTCTVSGEELTLNQWMVQEGWALAFRHYTDEFVPDELVAQKEGRGIWGSEFVPPWQWRQGVRLASNHQPTTGCRIKGNINTKGEHLFYLPRQARYEQVRIVEAKGERWFCSRQEARAAGWQAAPK